MIINKENLKEFLQRSEAHIISKFSEISKAIFVGQIGTMFKRLPPIARKLLYKIFEAGFVEGYNYAIEERNDKNG